MTFTYRLTCILGLLALTGGTGLGVAQDPEAAVEAAPVEVVEPLTRGPLHEAIAQPTDFQPEPGLAVPKEPPPPVPELPPEEQPEGTNVQWLGGYWAWDAERNDFLWVSGVYRDAPVGRRFVPGYWTHTDEGWRWVPGFWAPEAQEETPYVPEPPAPLEAGPALPAPTDDSIYLPGTWLYRESRFVWRPGYWSYAQPGRVWVSPRYLWTPAGYCFVDGYWDWPLEDRGMIFAPVVFHQPLWREPGWFYRPSYVVGWGSVLDSCFYHRPAFHFYFGNFYGPNYARLGYRPWFTGQGRYDPAFSYHRWQRRNDPNWFAGEQRRYDDRFAGRADGPPRTFAQQRTLAAQSNDNRNSPRINNNNNVNVQVVAPLNQVAQRKDVKLVKTSTAAVQQAKANVDRSREVAKARRQLETSVAKTPGAPAATKTARTLRLPTTGTVTPHTAEPRVVNRPAAAPTSGAPPAAKTVTGSNPPAASKETTSSKKEPTAGTSPGEGGKGTGTRKAETTESKGNERPRSLETTKPVAPVVTTPKATAPPVTPPVVNQPKPPAVTNPPVRLPQVIEKGPPATNPGRNLGTPPAAPKFTPPPAAAPRVAPPPSSPPRLSTPPAAPRSNPPPSAPRSNPPPAAPRSNPPPSAPRAAPPSAPRSAPPSAPRSAPPAPKRTTAAPSSPPQLTSVLVPKANAPAMKASAPAPKASAPAPRASAPAPRASAPAPRPSAPAPRVSAPAPRVSTPAPRPSAPVARPSAPAPRASAPPPRTQSAPRSAPAVRSNPARSSPPAARPAAPAKTNGKRR